ITAIAPKTYRVKGILWLDNNRCITLQVVFDDIRYSEINCIDRQTELIAIGRDINAGELKRLYLKYSS
ncbi:MAG: GTP-binding protein, partial [Bacteroidales bacterium]